MVTIPTTSTKRSVGSSSYEYESMSRLWKRSRAVLNGELYAKAHDAQVDTLNYTNLLVPFSPRMTQEQYRWFVAEAELPGLVSQYAKVIAGGLLRKPPSMVLPDTVASEAEHWLRNNFMEDGRSIISFLDEAIWEELTTSRCFISVDFPNVANYDSLSTEERALLNPYPVIWKAEDVINWQVGVNQKTGRPILTRVVFRYIDRDYSENTFHPDLKPTVADHYLDDSGVYRVQLYRKEGESTVDLTNGTLQMTELFGISLYSDDNWVKYGEEMTPMIHGEPFRTLPIFPLNGEIELEPPVLTSLIDREISLYNKVSRRNHLLYGASTYTPVVFSDMSDEEFANVVSAGLGSWIKLSSEDSIETLKTPTDALKDMDRAIEANVSDMSKMGIRMLSPESAQSGVALEIRNSSQTAQLGVLNTKISQTMTDVIGLMIKWKYGPDTDLEGLHFTLSSDFNPSPIGADWLRLVTDWYTSRIIPRSVLIKVAKENDLLPSDYDDEAGIEEINQDTLTTGM